MTTLNFPSVLVPLVGLVFPAIAMASLFFHVQKSRWHKISSLFYFQLTFVS